MEKHAPFFVLQILEEVIYYECLKLYKNNSEGRQKAEKSRADSFRRIRPTGRRSVGNQAVKKIA